MRTFLCIVFVLSGAAGLVYESIWTRYLGLFVGHSAYAQVLVLIIFLGGMSAGAMFVGRRSERVRQPLLWYALVELAVGVIGLVFHDVFLWATHAAYDTLFPALGPGSLHTMAKWLIAALLILPQSVLLGATFPLMTAGALRRAPKRAGRTISLLYFANSLGAAGGVGLTAVELGKAMGARVIAAASSEEKVDLAKKHGADDGFVYPSGKLSRDQQKEMSEEIKRLTGGKGADVLYDPVGGDYSEPAIRAMNWEGRFLVIGFAAGEIPRIPLNLTLLKSCDILGVFWGAFTSREPKKNQEHLAELTRWVVEGKIKPHVCAKFPLARAGEAIRMLADRKAQGKVVVTMN